MQRKSSHQKTASAKLTFVVLSDAEKPSRTYMLSKFQIGLIFLLGLVAIGALSIFAVINTPLGKLILPEYFSTQAEQLERVKALESKVEGVQQQLTYLTAYNVKLRRALGDSVVSDTTGGVGAANQVETERSPGQSQYSSEQQPLEKGAPTEYPSGYQGSSTGNYSQSMLSQQSGRYSGSEESNSIFPLMMPAAGFVTRGVDYAIQHYGLDISAPEGEPIVASAAGEVVFADWTLTGGNTLLIAHANDIITAYKHCERILVGVGTKVSRGEAIALVGSTGITSTGPHLHFELWRNGENMNPENFLLTKN